MAKSEQSQFSNKYSNTREELKKIAEYLDTKYDFLGFRVGWDAILGLIPGVGDLITSFFSLFILYKAAVLGCPPSVLLRMGLNIIIDNLLDAIPIIGNVFDIFWRSNMRNIALLEKYLAEPRSTVRASRAVVTLTLLLIGTLFIGCIVLAFYVATWIIGFFNAR